MKEEIARGLFAIAGIEIESIFKLANEYWPEHPDYEEIRRKNPWWLIKTRYGLIKIGWRKRVIKIDWSDTKLEKIITADDVTKDKSRVHAWTYTKALEYLIELSVSLAREYPKAS